jgi:archaellum component FlaF (FlaF/FlaG flagellin family)
MIQMIVGAIIMLVGVLIGFGMGRSTQIKAFEE